jgi:hypothetical protein
LISKFNALRYQYFEKPKSNGFKFVQWTLEQPCLILTEQSMISTLTNLSTSVMSYQSWNKYSTYLSPYIVPKTVYSNRDQDLSSRHFYTPPNQTSVRLLGQNIVLHYHKPCTGGNEVHNYELYQLYINTNIILGSL